MSLATGARLGPYEVVSPLGAGGMGEVFLGHDIRLHRHVALKRLKTEEQGGGGHGHSRLLREARAAARLNHPNIASIYDVLEQSDGAVIVMEYVDGESLRARLTRGPLPFDDVIALGRQLTDAVAAAHAQGVVHRDLKPSNIQLTPNGTLKVLDFGVAKMVMPIEQADSPTITCEQSRTLDIAGTPIYMAPEQLMGGEGDVRSDIYSLGVVLFEMATGRRPYQEADVLGLAVAMSTTAPPAADAVDPRVPHALGVVIGKALEREPRNRYASVRELGDALGSVAVNHAPEMQPPEPDRTPRRWFAAVIAFVVLVGLAMGLPRLLREAGPYRAVGVTRGPAVIAILPVENRAGDIRGEYVGAAVASVVAANFGSVSGLTVLPAAAVRDWRNRPADVDKARRELGATHVMALAVRAVAPATEIDATLTRTETGREVWMRSVRGDPLTVDRELLDQLGRALTRDGALPRPLTDAEWARIRKLPTQSADALQAYSEGRALLDGYDVAGNVERAIQLFQRATTLDPRFATAFAALGEALWKQYTREKRPDVAAMATAAVAKALTLDADLAPVYYSLGLMQSQTGHYEEATASLRHALELQPDSDETHRLLGRVLSTMGNHAAAIAESNRAILLRPFWNNYYSLGLVLYASGDHRSAITALTKATELQPTFSDAYQMLGTAHHMLGDVQQAIGYYEHAVRLGANAAAYANLGLAYYTVKQYEQARVAYADAITRQPRKATLHKSLGDVYVRLGRTAAARKSYEQAMALARDDLTVNPRDALAVVLVGLCEAKLGQRLAAERHAAEAGMLAPANQDVWFRIAKLYATIDERRSAGEAVRKAVSLGYAPEVITADDELLPLGPVLKQAIDAGLAARDQKGATR